MAHPRYLKVDGRPVFEVLIPDVFISQCGGNTTLADELLDVLREPLDFHYRLMGTAVDAHMTRYYTGLRMSEVPHQRAPSIIWSNFETVMRERTPILTNVPYVGPHKDFLRVQDLIMPLSSNGQDVDILFAVVDFLRRD